MDARLLDVIIGLSGFLVLIVMLAVLPMVMVSGIAYLTAIVIFILFLSGAGYLVNEKISLNEVTGLFLMGAPLFYVLSKYFFFCR